MAGALGVLVAVALPAVASADLYNPTTMQDVPSSYYYPPPAPSYDPPPPYYPPLNLTSTTPGSGGGSTGGGQPKPTREQRILGYTRSARVSRTANRQMASVFAKRLGAGNFDRARFIKEADKGTFRKAFRAVIKPLGWSDTNYADAVAAYTVSSYMIANQIAIEDFSTTQRLGAYKVEEALVKKLMANARMRRMSARGKQIATERLNTVTIVQLVQFANGDAAARAAQAQATRAAGLKTFKGDLTQVELTSDGFAPRGG
ncbi:MAG TPA: hypothetical protein VNS09_11520 [Solirubrobacter sp.]|nr:hypothetical protein [Solirubrobacter sp.]